MAPSNRFERLAPLVLAAGIAGCGGIGETTPTSRSAVPSIEPDALIGLTAPNVLETLGTPSFRRTDGAGEFWRYSNGYCHLHLYFYPPKAGGAARTRHIEARSQGTARAETRLCINAVLNGRGKGESG